MARPASRSEPPAPAGTTHLTPGDLARLQAPFPSERLGVKVQSLSREKNRAMLILYLNHIDVQARLEEVDPDWSSELMWEERSDNGVYTRVRLVVRGIARENVGEGGDPKAAASDALKRAAMLFGVGRYLYDSPTVWVDYDESKDRFRHWTIADYLHGLDRAGIPRPDWAEIRSPSTEVPTPEAAKAPSLKPGLKTRIAAPRTREELNRRLMNLYRPYLAQFPQTQFTDLLKERYGVAESRLMTVEQLEDLIGYLNDRLSSSA